MLQVLCDFPTSFIPVVYKLYKFYTLGCVPQGRRDPSIARLHGKRWEVEEAIVNFDLPLSDSVRGKSTLDGFIVAIVQMSLVRRRFGGSTKRVKTFVAPMGMKAQ